jgi:hypothetical protein
LLGLGEELDLANATEAELDVVPLDPHVADILGDVDLALHRLDVGNGREIEVLAPDIGRQFRKKGVADAAVAGAGPGFDPGGPLPVLAAALVVGQRRIDRDGDRRRAGIRAQAQIGAEDIAVVGAVLHQPGQPLYEARVEFRCLERIGQRSALRVEEGDNVDVAGVVEFAPAMLAEGKEGQPAIAGADAAG